MHDTNTHGPWSILYGTTDLFKYIKSRFNFTKMIHYIRLNCSPLIYRNDIQHICVLATKNTWIFLSLSPSLFSTVSEAHARSGHCRPSVTFLQTSLRSVTCVLRTCVLCTHVPSVASKSSQPFALIRPGRDLSSCACIEKNCFL